MQCKIDVQNIVERNDRRSGIKLMYYSEWLGFLKHLLSPFSISSGLTYELSRLMTNATDATGFSSSVRTKKMLSLKYNTQYMG